jgi:drug/metabolite transporter (DMT)-like permease
MALLGAYGVAVTYWWEGEFSKLLGLYVAFFLVVSQLWGVLAEHEDITPAKALGGILVVIGGCLIQLWPKAS